MASPPASRSGRGVVEEHSLLAVPRQAGVDAVWQLLKHLTRPRVQQASQLLEQELVAGQLGELLLLSITVPSSSMMRRRVLKFLG